MASSHHQEVEVLENWEEMADSDVLERKFNKLKPPNQRKYNNINSTTTTSFKIILTGDDALRSQYVPPEPTVTILKRPSKQNHLLSENKIVQPKKTLRQRELEYAEARLRILGEAAASPNKVDEGGNSQGHHRVAGAATCAAALATKPATTTLSEENVIRLPKGPDGSKGFVRR